MPAPNSEVSLPNPVEVPRYTLSEVVRYLRIPFWAAFVLRGLGPPVPDWFFDRYWRRLHHAYPDKEEERAILEAAYPRMSFQEFAVLFIKSSVLHLLREHYREPISPDLWVVLHHGWLIYPENDRLRSNPFADRSPEALAEVIAEWRHMRLPEDGREKAKKLALLYADRVDVEEGLAVRLFPFSREPSADAPRVILINPRKRFGQPIIAGTGVPTEIIGERFSGGDSVAELAKDYGIGTEQVEEAIRYESGMPCLWPLPLLGW